MDMGVTDYVEMGMDLLGLRLVLLGLLLLSCYVVLLCTFCICLKTKLPFYTDF